MWNIKRGGGYSGFDHTSNPEVHSLNMKEAFVDKTVTVAVRDTEVPVPKPNQVLIRVVVSGTNPKDWKVPRWIPDAPPSNQGDDIAGFVEAVGEGVVGFKKGDKVAAFHEMMKPHGSYGEYAIAWEHTTFHLTSKTSFEGEKKYSTSTGCSPLTSE
jgi:NADPH:quinone reductase-like Zn-dependent oxidoreductase